MIEKVTKTIKKYSLLKKGDRVIAAVSGGADSVCLLKVLAALSREWELGLLAVHVNHGLRGEEADRDELFVNTLCGEMGIPFERRGMSPKTEPGRRYPEELCREERYRLLLEVLKERGFDRIAVGHHMDDLAETVLMNLLRGSGPEGLRGFLPAREGIFIRPLYHLNREEILAYLENTGASFVRDSSNEDEGYARNRVRRFLIPFLQREFNPRLVEAFSRTADVLHLENECLKEIAKEAMADWGIQLPAGVPEAGVRIPLSPFRNCHEAVQRRIIREILAQWIPGLRGIGHAHIQSVVSLTGSNDPGAHLDLPHGVIASREYGEMVLKAGKAGKAGKVENGFRCAVSIPGEAVIPGSGKKLVFELLANNGEKCNYSDQINRAYLDFDILKPPLEVRSPLPGDRIQPFGMAGTKKLQDLFTDLKLPRLKRRSVPLLVDRESVLWAAGIRLSERARVTADTKSILKVEII
ncbi:MAG: tRNA lysidine(34) synthetase TilS [Syntrophales bacterium]|nr:tRNA lysidine(34) synthetase TilS [Syntrophales bacterium]MDD5532101.1 tRNA lysidine(34) synthetase TilS [Syntrophales bacterium]